MRKAHGFREQATSDYSEEVAMELECAIEKFPFCTILNQKFCVVNGGVSGKTFEETSARESLWGYFDSKSGVHRRPEVPFFTFGPDIVNEFLENNRCEVLVVSGQKQVDGYKIDLDGKVVCVSSGLIGARPLKSGIAKITGKEIEMEAFDLNTVIPITVHADGDSPGLNGLFAKIRQDYDVRSAHEMGLFRVVSSSEDQDIVPVTSVVSSGNGIAFMTFPQPGNSHIAFVFMTALTIEAYTIQSALLPRGNDHMKTWKLMGSNDGRTFSVIDERHDVEELNGPLATKTFRVQNPGTYKLIMLLQHERNHRGNWNLCVNHVDFFGTIEKMQ